MIESVGLLPAAEKAVDLARDIVLHRLPGSLTVKGDRDMATDVDYAVEREVRNFLANETPGIPFLGEEEGRVDVEGSRMLWVLDPIDGTANFTHGLPLCAISLALLRDEKPIVAVISVPFLGQQYTAAADQGAFCNGQRIDVSTTNNLTDAIVSIGDFAVGEGSTEKNKERLALTALLAANVQRMRMIGAAAIDLVWVADGKLDATIILSNKPWDTSAGVLIAREAGAVVTDRDGRPHTFNSAATIAVAPKIAEPLASMFNQLSVPRLDD